MTYQVLARKYRPQKFAEVVGQDHITTTLKNALAQSRLHHAYLFTGARGIGKTTVARILAKALNCQNLKGAEPCGKCSPCVEITAGTSLDVQEIDGASNTSVEDVREIRERVKYMPSSGRYKIYIIDEVHMLSTSAFNALLKTLEEPPAHVVFIFATTEAHKIPATILSRCQRHDFRRIAPSKIAATLKRIAKGEGATVDDEALRLISHEATGSLRDAESLFDQSIAFAGNDVTAETIKSMLGFLDRKRIFDVMEATLEKDPKRALAVLDEVFETGADIVRFAMDVLEMLRHALVLSECGGARGTIDLAPDEAKALGELLKETAAPELHQMFSIWYGIAEQVARSPFPKMLFEVGLIRLCRAGPVRQISEIVARLDAIVEAPGGAAADAGPAAQASLPTAPKAVPQAKPPADAPAPPDVDHPSPTFEPGPSRKDAASERRWEEFMRWLVVKRPQAASILQHGVLVGIDGGVVKLSFDNPLYADMLAEAERRQHLEKLFGEFFKRTMQVAVAKTGEADARADKGHKKRELMREALDSDIVRKAADILNAQLHDVKVEGEK